MEGARAGRGDRLNAAGLGKGSPFIFELFNSLHSSGPIAGLNLEKLFRAELLEEKARR